MSSLKPKNKHFSIAALISSFLLLLTALPTLETLKVSMKEELAEKQTRRDHLRTRSYELKKDLQTARELSAFVSPNEVHALLQSVSKEELALLIEQTAENNRLFNHTISIGEPVDWSGDSMHASIPGIQKRIITIVGDQPHDGDTARFIEHFHPQATHIHLSKLSLSRHDHTSSISTLKPLNVHMKATYECLSNSGEDAPSKEAIND
jgi:hypothetical protein